MRCPNCGYHNVDWAESCKKCSGELNPRFVRRVPRVSSKPNSSAPSEAPELRDEHDETVRKAPMPPMPVERDRDQLTLEGLEGSLSEEPLPGEVPAAPPPAMDIEPSLEPEDFSSSLEDPIFEDEFDFPKGELPSPPSAEVRPEVKQNETAHFADEQMPPIEEMPAPPPEKPILDLEDEWLEPNVLEELRELEGYDEIIDDRELVSFDLAGVGSRFAAILIDAVIVALIAVVTVYVGYLLAGNKMGSEYVALVSAPVLLLTSLYFILLPAFSGQTLGKKILNIRVIGETGEPIGVFKSFLRWIGYYISSTFLFLGFIWAIFDGDSQAWHDKIAKTYVVKD